MSSQQGIMVIVYFQVAGFVLDGSIHCLTQCIIIVQQK